MPPGDPSATRSIAASVLSALAGVKIDGLDDINFEVYYYVSLYFLFTLRTLHHYNARKTRLPFPRYRILGLASSNMETI